ncbi:ABC transporter permease subunit [Streptococcus suis]|nr:ABC transporter permease subunit [Streptococcus suis]
MILFEIKKLLKKTSSYAGLVVAVLILAGLLYGIFLNGQLSGYSTDKIRGRDSVTLNTKIANQYAGSLSDEKIEAIITQFAENNDKNQKSGFFDVFSWYISKEFILDHSSYDSELENYKKNGSFDIKNVALKKVDDLDLAVPLNTVKLGNFASWNQLFQLLSATFILIGILLIYILSPIFSGDEMRGILPLLLTTKFGRTKLTYSKVIATFLIFLSSFILFHGLILTLFAYYFGLSGWDTSVQMNFYWKLYNLPFSINFFQIYLTVLAYHFVALLLVCSTTSLISYFTKNTFTTLSLSLGVFLLPQLLLQIFKSGIVSKLLTFCPIANIDTESLLLKLSYSETFLFSNFYLNLFIVLFLMTLLAILFNAIIIKKQRIRVNL